MDKLEWYRREEEIVEAFTEVVLEDMLSHFLPGRCPWYRDRRTWIMVRMGREVRSRTD